MTTMPRLLDNRSDHNKADVAPLPPRRLGKHYFHHGSLSDASTAFTLPHTLQRRRNYVICLLGCAGLQKVAAQNNPPSPAPSEPPLDGTNNTLPSEPTLASAISTAPIIPTPTISPFPTTNSSSPTAQPIPTPTISPSSTLIMPSAAPSNSFTNEIQRPCSQTLQINDGEEFDDIELGIYQLQMQSYTENFGYMIANPQIITTCQVTEQNLASGARRKRSSFFNMFEKLWPWRRLQTTSGGTLLYIEFDIKYSTSYNYTIDDYPSKFMTYVNSNLEMVTADMKTRFLPVVEAKEVLVYSTDVPTTSPKPTLSPAYIPPVTASPIRQDDTLAPTPVQTPQPSVSTKPSLSSAPILLESTPKPTRQEIVNDQHSFVVGLAAGLSGAALVVILFILYTKRSMRLNKKRLEEVLESSQKEMGGIELGGYDGSRVASKDGIEDGTSHLAKDAMDARQEINSVVSEGGSLGSNPYDIQEGVPLETLQDEFDNYKNQDLEFMRNGVEESVYGAEGMMSLAMTRALMEEEEEEVDWGGAQDCASMEANIFCDANDWLRKNEGSSLDTRIAFFQNILNKMVITVRRGMVRPQDGTRAIHCCAAMLGIPLEAELPNNVLLVYGMRKTNDLSHGRSYLIEAFKIFGDIETAGINPRNKGFGFVRFVHPKSVERAFDRFRVSEIEVQDVSVMMKPLKPELEL